MTEDGPDGEWPVDHDDEDRPRILYPVVGAESAPVLRIADAIASETNAEILVGHVVDPDGESLTEISREVSKTIFESKMDPAMSAPIESRSITGKTARAAIVRAAETYDIDAILMEVAPEDDLDERIRSAVDVDVIAVSNAGRLESVASILVPVSDDHISTATVGVASTLAAANDAWLELIFAVDDESGQAAGDAALADRRAQFGDVVEIDTRVVRGTGVTEVIAEQSNYHDLTIVGGTERGRLGRLVFGSSTNEIRERVNNAVLTVRGGSDRSLF